MTLIKLYCWNKSKVLLRFSLSLCLACISFSHTSFVLSVIVDVFSIHYLFSAKRILCAHGSQCTRIFKHLVVFSFSLFVVFWLLLWCYFEGKRGGEWSCSLFVSIHRIVICYMQVFLFFKTQVMKKQTTSKTYCIIRNHSIKCYTFIHIVYV